jgi:hypothetical protein
MTWTANPSALEWQDSETQGIPFRFQALLGGEGGPEAIRLSFGECPSVYAHMHLVSQFQVVLAGSMVMPRGMTLRPYSVQYSDHSVPYGPFSTTSGHEMLVLHPRPGGLLTMGDPQFRRHINLEGRLLMSQEEDHAWRVGAEGERKTLIPEALGPRVGLARIGPGGAVSAPPAPFGRYEVVLAGSMWLDGVPHRAARPPFRWPGRGGRRGRRWTRRRHLHVAAVRCRRPGSPAGGGHRTARDRA